MHLNPFIKNRPGPVTPAGGPKGARLAVLEQGAHLLQTAAPLGGFDAYVVGFHPAKDDPQQQMEAHHFCKVVNGDLLQCVLFDGNTRGANLIGIEYIISGRLFETLPDGEQGYWHPHNYEVLSGELVAPGLPEAAEEALMALLVNSYGKTWHTWHTGTHDRPGMALPLGDARLMWSFNRDGECDERLRHDRNTAMGLDVEAKRAERQRLVPLARPQCGVDVLRASFPGSTPVPGVLDVRDAAPGAAGGGAVG